MGVAPADRVSRGAIDVRHRDTGAAPPPRRRRAQHRPDGRSRQGTRRRTPATRQDAQVCGARSPATRARRAGAHGIDAGRGGGIRPGRGHRPHVGLPHRSEPRRPRAAHRRADRGDAPRRGRRPAHGPGAGGLGPARLAEGGLRQPSRGRQPGVPVRAQGCIRAGDRAGTGVRRHLEPLGSRLPHHEQGRGGPRGGAGAERDGRVRRPAA